MNQDIAMPLSDQEEKMENSLQVFLFLFSPSLKRKIPIEKEKRKKT